MSFGRVRFPTERLLDAHGDLDRADVWLPLGEVTLGGGHYSRALLRLAGRVGHARVALQALGKGTAAGGPVGDEVALAPDDAARLLVHRDDLEAALLDLTAHDAEPRLILSIPLERVIAGTSNVVSGTLRVRVGGTRRPQATDLTLVPLDVDLGAEGTQDRVTIGELRLDLSPDVALAPAGTRLDLALIANRTDLDMRLETDTEAERLVSVVAVGADRVGLITEIVLARPVSAAARGRFGLAVTADRRALVRAFRASARAEGDHWEDAFGLNASVSAWRTTGGLDLAGERRAVREAPARIRLVMDRRIRLAVRFAGESASEALDKAGDLARLTLPAITLPLHGADSHATLRAPDDRVVIDVIAHDGLPVLSVTAQVRAEAGGAAAAPVWQLETTARGAVETSGTEGAQRLAIDLDRTGAFDAILAATLARFADETKAASRRRRHRLTVELAAGGTPLAVIDIPLHVEDVARRWPLVVDLGTSSTAIWVGAAERRLEPGDEHLRALALGEWLERIDPIHDESRLVTGARQATLLPGHVGLSSSEHLRARYHPASLGDLTFAGDEPDAVAARLAHFGRRYDVSVPFPQSFQVPNHCDEIVFDLKQHVMRNQTTIRLAKGVAEWVDGALRETRVLDVKALLADYFDELFKFHVARALLPRVGLDGEDLSEVIDAARVIVTHPCGIGREQAHAYRASLGRFARAELTAPTEAARRPASRSDVLLIPESYAAARHALRDLPVEAEESAFGLVAIDVGAGTTDITIARVRPGSNQRRALEPVAHFGVPMAGDLIDDVLMERLTAWISAALEAPELAAGFEMAQTGALSLDDVSMLYDTNNRRRLKLWARRELKIAKARLSQRLGISDTRSDEPYRWRAAPGAGRAAPPLRLRLYETATRTGLVRPKAAAKSAPARLDVTVEPLDGVQVRITSVPADEQEAPGLFAEVSADAFALDARVAAWESGRGFAARLADVMMGLGEDLPAIALGEARRRLGDVPIRVAVSGRGALWPPLFERIAATVQEADRSELGRPTGRFRLTALRPASPTLMKRAVIVGASLLVEDGLAADHAEAVENPLAIVELDASAEAADAPDLVALTRRAVAIRYLDVSDTGTARFEFRPEGRFQLVRAIPGLDDERLKRLARLPGSGGACTIPLIGRALFEAADLKARPGDLVRVSARRLPRHGVEIALSPVGTGRGLRLVLEDDVVKSLVPFEAGLESAR